MFSCPSYGWSQFEIKKDEISYKAPMSYLTDVPGDLLKSMDFALSNGLPFCCEFDCEGYSFTIVANDFETIILDDKNEVVAIPFDNYNKYTLAIEIVKDIKRNYAEWLDWNVDVWYERSKEELDKELQEHMSNIIKLLESSSLVDFKANEI